MSPYLNVDEVESALLAAALAYPSLCTLIQLPNISWEGRTVSAVRLRAGVRPNRHGVLLLGGVHAREWGSSDILISFVETLLDAFTRSTGVVYGNMQYTTTEIIHIFENIDLFIVPDVNPDGKYWSQNNDRGWRTNRGPIPGSAQIGTDLNRNFDFLWDFRTAFSPHAITDQLVRVSDTPGSELFHGPAPFSEPETRNVKYLLDTNQNIRVLVDLHSFRELILNPWGDDINRTDDPSVNFRNPLWNGKRGLGPWAHWYGAPDCGEYVHQTDDYRWGVLASKMQVALQGVRGKYYFTGQGYLTLYGTCGTSHCYAFSRHLVDSSQTKIDGFLIEWGTTFQPDYSTNTSEMTLIIADVSAALARLCLDVDDIPKISVAPALLDFSGVRVNAAKTLQIQITNLGTTDATIVNTTLEAGPDNAQFSISSTNLGLLSPNNSRLIAVKFLPNAARQFSAVLLLEFQKSGVSWRDITRVQLRGVGCQPACAAPVFAPMNAFEFLLFLLYCLAAVPVLSAFAWLPNASCLLRQLLFRLKYWNVGNSDPCLAI